MKIWSYGGLFSLALAVLVAGWCVGWLWLLLQATRTLPGIFSFRPGIGAFELLEFPTGLPYRIVLLAIFLFCMLPVLLLSALRSCWDGNGRALDALLWPLRTKVFWLPCLSWSISAAMLAILFKSQDVPGLVLTAISILALMVAPFLCLNPSTLDASAPARWWQPAWPGAFALGSCLLLWLASTIASFAIGEVIAISPVRWLDLGLWFLDELISIFIAVLFIVIWLNHGQWRKVRGDLANLWRNGFTGEVLWQSFAMALVGFTLAFPLLVSAIEAIYVVPQYERWARESGSRLSPPLQFQAKLFRANGLLLLGLTVPFGFYFLLALGRLMRRRSVDGS